MISAFVATYGYVAVFVGTLLEGETVLLAAGFAAHRGLLDWRLVVAIAGFGATLGDQAAFLLGRWRGPAIIARFDFLSRHAPRVHALMERRPALLIVAMRFLYGMRLAGPIVMGSSRVPLWRFSLLNMLGAAIWAALVTAVGFYFGMALETVLSDIKHVEEAVLVGILLAGSLWWLWRHRSMGR